MLGFFGINYLIVFDINLIYLIVFNILVHCKVIRNYTKACLIVDPINSRQRCCGLYENATFFWLICDIEMYYSLSTLNGKNQAKSEILNVLFMPRTENNSLLNSVV